MGISPYLQLALGMGAMYGGTDPLIKQSPAERMVSNADVQSLINEYHLIKQKKSRLSANQRYMVECKVEYLIEKGTIKMNK